MNNLKKRRLCRIRCPLITVELLRSPKLCWRRCNGENYLIELSTIFYSHQLLARKATLGQIWQEDAHEFLQNLLNKLSSSSPQDDNIVQKVFGGHLLSELRCCECKNSSEKDVPFNDLSLEIQDAETLQDALASFTNLEKMEEKAKCNKCEVAGHMEKQTKHVQALSVAALHLKRFQYLIQHEKIGKHVKFSLELDLVPYSDQSNNSQDDFLPLMMVSKK